MKDVTKVFCEAAFYFRVLQCSTCCCVGGLLKIDKSFMMTKETSKQCASWFTWQEVMINLSMGIMRANIEKNMRNTELCKTPNYFEENPEPQCSEKRWSCMLLISESTQCCLPENSPFMNVQSTSSFQFASWFMWQEVMFNLSLGIMRANIEKDMRNTELCKAPNFFEENPEPQCSEEC